MDYDKKKKILNAIKESTQERKKRLEGMNLTTRVKKQKKGKGSYVRNKNYKKDI